LRRHAERARDALRRNVPGANQRNHLRALEDIECVFAHAARRFACVAAAPERPVHEISDLGLPGSFDLLHHQPDLADRRLRIALGDEPHAVPVIGVALDLPLDPGLRLVARVALRIETHHLRMIEHRRDEIQIVQRHLAQRQALGGENSPHATLRNSAAGPGSSRWVCE
jgi:hypothetical protein